jgi:hypothetical protein
MKIGFCSSYNDGICQRDNVKMSSAIMRAQRARLDMGTYLTLMVIKEPNLGKIKWQVNHCSGKLISCGFERDSPKDLDHLFG